MPISAQKINPCLWFDTEAEEAAKFYCSIFKNARMGKVSHYVDEGQEIHGKPAGSVLAVEFDLDGQKFAALNGGPQFRFNEAISFQIQCDDQQEVDYFWSRLTAGGSEVVCGWLKDKFGLSWQVVPSILYEMLVDPDPQKVKRVTKSFLQMKKFDIAALKRAFDGGRTVSDTKAGSKTAPFEFVIKRTFNAPVERVWRAWTEPERMAQWWGPKGFTCEVMKLDLRPGGTFHYRLRSPQGEEMWGRFAYREIVPKERLVYINSFSDREGGVTRHPLHKDWPLELLSTVTFVETGGKTTVTIHWVPYEASETERVTFENGKDSMQGGWTGTLDQLEAYLAKA